MKIKEDTAKRPGAVRTFAIDGNDLSLNMYDLNSFDSEVRVRAAPAARHPEKFWENFRNPTLALPVPRRLADFKEAQYYH